MAGLLFSSIGIVVQGGFVIGVGILLDTFVVRTITVPAIAALNLLFDFVEAASGGPAAQTQLST